MASRRARELGTRSASRAAARNRLRREMLRSDRKGRRILGSEARHPKGRLDKARGPSVARARASQARSAVVFGKFVG